MSASKLGRDTELWPFFTFENPTWFELFWTKYLSRGPFIVREPGLPGDPSDAGSFIKLSPIPTGEAIEPGVRIEMEVSTTVTAGRPFQLGMEYFPPSLRAVGMWNRACDALGLDRHVEPVKRVVWSETVTP